MFSAIRARSALVVLAMGMAGCVVTEQSVFPQLAGDHDRYLPGDVGKVAALVGPWLEEHHCFLTSRSDGGVTCIDCTVKGTDRLTHRFRVTLTPWVKNGGTYTRIHVEKESCIGSEFDSGVGPSLLDYIDALNERPEAALVLLAKNDQPQTEEARAIERIQKLHGTIQREPSLPGAPVVGVDLHSTRTTDDDLALLRGVPAVVKLNLFGTRITDAGLANLAALPGLQTLYLNQTQIGDAGLERLSGLKNLRELGLYRTRVTDSGLEKLKCLPSLQQLTVSGRPITDAGLAHLKGMASLRELSIRDTSATDAGVADLKKALPRLVVLR